MSAVNSSKKQAYVSVKINNGVLNQNSLQTVIGVKYGRLPPVSHEARLYDVKCVGHG